MGKLKLPLCLLLVAVLLVTGAFLPQISAAVLDHTIGEQGGSSPIQPVQLELNQKKKLTDLEKLYLVNISECIDASVDDTVMSEEDVKAAVKTALEPYFDAGLIRGWDGEYTISCRPVLGFDVATGLYDYSWSVYLSNESSPVYTQMNLVIDDETGKLLHIYYWIDEPVFSQEEMDGCLKSFTEIFRSELDLGIPYSERDTTTSKDGRSMQYFWSFWNVDGEIGFAVDFCIYPYGFYLL